MSFAQILSSATVLFLVMDPLGNIPLFLSLLKHLEPRRRRQILVRELLIALGILTIFLFLGQELLDFLHLDQESVRMAGGIVLFVIALRMIFPTKHGVMGDVPDEEPFIVPLAIPLIAGPSALATLILMVRSDPAKMLDWSLTLLLAWGLSAAILLAAPFLYKLLHDRGLAAIERLMGMLLIMISVQMLMDAVRSMLATGI